MFSTVSTRRAADDRQFSVLISLDLSAEFDSVDHALTADRASEVRAIRQHEPAHQSDTLAFHSGRYLPSTVCCML